MTGSGERSVEEVAAAWLARLRSRSISTAELEEFARWRRDPIHAAAYERAQTIWDEGARLSTDPDIQRALHGGTIAGRRDTSRFPMPPRLALASLAAAALIALGVVSLRPGSTATSYQTAIGEQSSVRLPDGSTVQLDTDSEVASRFEPDERRIALIRGQAFFQVAHATERPFVVDAGDGITVTALGTQFDVRRTAERIVVALASGRVVVRRGEVELARLRPGTVVEVAIGNGVVATSGNLAQATSWRSGHLTFRDTPLATAVAEINRYTSAKVIVRDPGSSAEPVSGEFSTGDPEGFSRAVNTLLGEGTVSR